MSAFLFLLGAIQILAAAGVFLAAKSAIHEILSAIAFGMGVLSLGIGALIQRTSEVQKIAVDQLTELRALNKLNERISDAFDRIGR